MFDIELSLEFAPMGADKKRGVIILSQTVLLQ